jgi:hypothetical protein
MAHTQTLASRCTRANTRTWSGNWTADYRFRTRIATWIACTRTATATAYAIATLTATATSAAAAAIHLKLLSNQNRAAEKANNPPHAAVKPSIVAILRHQELLVALPGLLRTPG